MDPVPVLPFSLVLTIDALLNLQRTVRLAFCFLELS